MIIWLLLLLPVARTSTEDDLLLVDGDSKYLRDEAIEGNEEQFNGLQGVIVAPLKGQRVYTRDEIVVDDINRKEAALRAFYDRMSTENEAFKETIDPIFVTRPPPRTTLSTTTRGPNSSRHQFDAFRKLPKEFRLSSDTDVDRVHSARLVPTAHQIRSLSSGREKLVPFASGTSSIVPLNIPLITGKTATGRHTAASKTFFQSSHDEDDEHQNKKPKKHSQIPTTPVIRFPLKAWQIPNFPTQPFEIATTGTPILESDWSNARAPLVFQFNQDDQSTNGLQAQNLGGITNVNANSPIYPPRLSGESGGTKSQRRSHFPMKHPIVPIPLPQPGGFEPAFQEIHNQVPEFSASIDESIVSIDRDESAHQRMSATEKLRHFVTKFPEVQRFSQQMDIANRSPDITSFSRTAIGDIFRELSPLHSHLSLSANEKLRLCCRKQRLSDRCSTLCDFDTFTDKSLITAVLTLQCPGQELGRAFDCASSKADHTDCCARAGLGSFLGGRCLPFCQTHRDTPPNIVDYLPCLQVFDTFKRCFREYQTNNKNLFGD